MLKGIPTIISPDLLKILAEMGHGDEIVIADAHFPAYSVNSKVMRADGVNAPELAAAVMKLIELDSYVEFPALMMQTVPGDTADVTLRQEYQKALKNAPIGFLERFDFYRQAKSAYCVVITGEKRKYGNIILKKGVVAE